MNIPKKIVNKIMKIASLQEEVENWFKKRKMDIHISIRNIRFSDKPMGEPAAGENIFILTNFDISGNIYSQHIFIKVSKNRYLRLYVSPLNW